MNGPTLIIPPATGGGGGSSAGNAHGCMYRIERTVPASDPMYTVYDNSTGSVVFAEADTPSTSGFLACLEDTVDHGVSWFLNGPHFSFIQEIEGEQDHFAPNGYDGLTILGRGMYETKVQNWRDDTGGTFDQQNRDVEPFSLTRCDHSFIGNMEIFAGGNRDVNNSSDTMDYDGCKYTRIERVLVRRSRARAMVYDGGDSGAASTGGLIFNTEIRGIPPRPGISRVNAGGLTAQLYRYCVSWVDSVFGEGPPSNFTEWLSDGTVNAKVTVGDAPYFLDDPTLGVTARKIYRWSTAQPVYHLLTTISDATTREWTDSATDASISGGAVPNIGGLPTIPAEGCKFLSGDGNTFAYNTVEGTGGAGWQTVRKGTTAETNHNARRHICASNRISFSGIGQELSSKPNIYVGGADWVKVVDNDLLNPGYAVGPDPIDTYNGYNIYVQALEGATTKGTVIDGNTCVDDRGPDTPHIYPVTLNNIRINSAGTPNPSHTRVGVNHTEGATGDAIVNSTGEFTHQLSEIGHLHGASEGAIQILPWAPGKFYGAASQMSGTSSPQVAVANHMYGSPVYIAEDYTITDIQINVTNNAGTLMRLGIYELDPDDDQPGNLIYQTTDLSPATNGIKGLSGLSEILTGGSWVVLAVVTNGAPTLSAISSQMSPLGFDDAADTSKAAGWNSVIGAGWTDMPPSWPSSPSESSFVMSVFVARA